MNGIYTQKIVFSFSSLLFDILNVCVCVCVCDLQACGVLIEMEGDMLLVGIGCNVLSAPTVNANTNNANAAPTIRPATCLADHNRVYAQLVESMQQQTQECAASSSGAIDGQRIELTMRAGDVHKELGLDICDHLYDWLASQADTAALVVQDFERNMDLSPQRLRDIADPALSTVIPTALNIDGTLKVVLEHNFPYYLLLFFVYCFAYRLDVFDYLFIYLRI